MTTELSPLYESRDFPQPSEETRVIVIANQKGGVGKTTTAVNLAASLGLHGALVLVADMDPQGNASTALGIKHYSGVPGTYEVLIGNSEDKHPSPVPIEDVMQESPISKNIHVIPATIDLAGAEIELVSVVARESRLKRAIGKCEVPFNYIIIDCPPSLGLLTMNAMIAGNEVLIPIQCEYYALEGLSMLLGNIERIRSSGLNDDLHVSAMLLTMYANLNIANGVVDEIKEHFPQQLLNTRIPRSVKTSEAPSYEKPVITYAPYSAGALAYTEAARELAARGAK